MGHIKHRRELTRETQDLLAGLGADPDAIARSLTDHGAHGLPKDSSRCVLAVYLHAVMTVDRRIASIEVTNDAIRIRESGRRGRVAIPLPNPIRAFIVQFDSGRFPTLTVDRPGAPARDAVATSGEG